MEKKCAWAMGDAFGVHPFHKAKIVYMTGRMRKKLADVLSCLPVLFETPKRLHHAVFYNFPCFREGSRVIKSDHLSIVSEEVFLVVVGVHMTDSASHEQEDDTFCPGGVMHYLHACCAGMLMSQRAHSETTETAGHVAEGMSAGDRHGWMHGVSSKSTVFDVMNCSPLRRRLQVRL